MSRPSVVGTATTFTSASAVTSFSITKPTGVVDGEALIMVLSGQSSTMTGDYASSGWSRISAAYAGADVGRRIIAIYARTVASGASGLPASFTFTSTDSASGGRIAATMFRVQDADLTSLVVVASAFSGSAVGSTFSVSPGTAINESLLLTAWGAQWAGAADHAVSVAPTGGTQQTALSTGSVGASRTSLYVYRQDTDAGAVGTKSLTYVGTQSAGGAVAVILRGLPSNTGVAVKYTSATDTLSTGHLFYCSATDTLATPLEVRAMPTGYTSVTSMLGTSGFNIAHRGGSATWPEMSLHAYTQAAWWGVGALELSLARTSDGVWFGLHDDTLDRTTSGLTGYTASAHTWAEISALSHNADLPSGQTAKPYMRLEDYVTAYGASHVTFVDPKVAVGNLAELLALLSTLYGGDANLAARVVLKYYGVAGPSIPAAGQARGMKTWGYFYQADSADFATYQGRWDLLGMDYTADAGTWTTILSYGKPVISHTIATAANRTTATGLGAAGHMVSGVTAALTRTP